MWLCYWLNIKKVILSRRGKYITRHIKEVLLRFPWNETLPLLHCALETLVLALQHGGLWTDMRDFLIICPVNAGRLVGGGRLTSRLLVGDRGRLVMVQGRFRFSQSFTCSFWKRSHGLNVSHKSCSDWRKRPGLHSVKHRKHPGHVSYNSGGVRKNCCQYLSCHMAQQLSVSQSWVWFLPSGVSAGREQAWQPVTGRWLLDPPWSNAV